MLLRSASSPIPTSRLTSMKDPSPDYATAHPQIRRSGSITHPVSSATPRQALTRALSEDDLTNPSAATKRGRPRGSHGPSPILPSESEIDRSPKSSLVRLLSSSGLTTMNVVDEYCTVESDVKTLVEGGGCGGGGGRKVCGGSGDVGGGFDFSDTDAYYQKMIEANPGDSLVLGNYARFLKEVRGDLEKAEKYCERAIVANSGDADVLSLYADLVWQTDKDAKRAERYFDQAVQAAPEDSYVMASYAQFMWDVGDEEEKDEAVKGSNFAPPSLFDGYTLPSAAAAS